jgi:hypothetical protein
MIRLMPAVSSLHVFVVGAAGVGLVLVGLAAIAPRAWYGWSPARRRLLGRRRFEIGLTGAALFVGTAVALFALAPQ